MFFWYRLVRVILDKRSLNVLLLLLLLLLHFARDSSVAAVSVEQSLDDTQAVMNQLEKSIGQGYRR